MTSTVEYKTVENIQHVKYTNLYYINKEFYYFAIKNSDSIDIKPIKTLGGPEHTRRIKSDKYEILPKIKYFKDETELNNYVNSLNIKELNKPTLHFSHYYDHNIAHGLYDALYPIYLCYLRFFHEKKNESFNMFLNILIDPGGWRMPENYVATRDWVLNIFNDFCLGGEFMYKNNTTRNIKFNTLLVGGWHAGISFVNKKFIMPGKDILALEKFRDRFLKAYNINPPKKTNKIKITIVNSHRYSKKEKHNLIKILVDYSKKENIETKLVNWKDVPDFKMQLEILNNCDIHISCAGTSMLNFPFLKDNSIHINLGVREFWHSIPLPSLMETNICLLSNNIYCEFYNIYKFKEVLYYETKLLLDKSINNLKNNIYLKSKQPDYINKWQKLCLEFPNETQELIHRLNGEKEPSLIFVRFPDFIIYEYIDYYKQFLNELKNRRHNFVL